MNKTNHKEFSNTTISDILILVEEKWGVGAMYEVNETLVKWNNEDGNNKRCVE